ncbi:isochorismatase family protein [Sphingomonas astaxanthinifaciens]|uniref:N-carbamoylsarcosine amidase n=1 Tax=Sphingomonas astaxanthinifaciens DSM 22298 TaxID=1123267 RepID=A0ABQ5Z6F5_9SPHN|nr:isochorismatase family protein [Sphingomonas astaxanthinifaciens]GLR46359.1 N-carbamoylsarcosine amidase [Sphingomonas astaxanthinifaciens DSM 22298]
MSVHGADVQQDYAASGFGGSLPWGRRPALLLVDWAAGYFTDGSPLRAPVESCRDVARSLAEQARRQGIPLVFTRVEYPLDKEAEPARLFRRKIAGLACWEAGNPLGEFTPDLAPQDGDIVVTKQFPSAFFGTDLAEQLRARGIDTILVTGLTTSGCVRASALDALCHGFAPLVVRDACGDREAAIHEANLFDLQAKYADVITAAQAKDYLASLT